MQVFTFRTWGCHLMLVFAVVYLTMGWTEANPLSTEPPPAPTHGSRIELGAPVKFRIGQTAIVDRDNVQLKLLNVIEDSRCPKEVNCIQAGQVTAVFSVFNEKEKPLGKTVRLTSRSAQAHPAEADFGGYVMTLVEVEPYPRGNRKIQRSDYIATIQIRKR